MNPKMSRPWTDFYDPELQSISTHSEDTMYQLVSTALAKRPLDPAIMFQNTVVTAEDMLAQINRVAAGLHHKGFRAGDVATICLPNTPHAPIAFYAVQRLGGICSMVHPLMPADAVDQIMISTDSHWLITIDGFLPRLQSAIDDLFARKNEAQVVACAIGDYLKGYEKLGFFLKTGRKIPALPSDLRYILWRSLILLGEKTEHEKAYTDLPIPTDADTPAIYLQSGGTTGSPKAIMLSSRNMNTLALQGPGLVRTPNPRGMKMLSILPFFHGFGLCMQMHTMFAHGIVAVLVPQFSPENFAKTLLHRKTEFLVGVPTLFEGLLSAKHFKDKDLSFIRAVFCGGDTLTPDLKQRIDRFLKDHGCKVEVREGYGLTETVTVCTLNPERDNRAGSVGLPLQGIDMCVVEPDTTTHLTPGTDGELCVTGPTVMLGYLGNSEETGAVIRMHEDGRKWVHTGDFGSMDEDGYVYYRQRLKRIIKVSGIAVFPAELEGLLTSEPSVKQAAVIGIPHPYKMEVPYAYVVLNEGETPSDRLEEQLIQRLKESVLRHAVPVGISFIEELPLTRMNKVDTLSLLARYQDEHPNADA